MNHEHTKLSGYFHSNKQNKTKYQTKAKQKLNKVQEMFKGFFEMKSIH